MSKLRVFSLLTAGVLAWGLIVMMGLLVAYPQSVSAQATTPTATAGATTAAATTAAATTAAATTAAATTAAATTVAATTAAATTTAAVLGQGGAPSTGQGGSSVAADYTPLAIMLFLVGLIALAIFGLVARTGKRRL
ncbi:MAG TPA: hypothetical protein VH186_37470 [Chloroflexia bacterium]|nr:hypothetical protein [Chloroflexia bacterium]